MPNSTEAKAWRVYIEFLDFLFGEEEASTRCHLLWVSDHRVQVRRLVTVFAFPVLDLFVVNE